jgi:hypothetical protein
MFERTSLTMFSLGVLRSVLATRPLLMVSSIATSSATWTGFNVGTSAPRSPIFARFTACVMPTARLGKHPIEQGPYVRLGQLIRNQQVSGSSSLVGSSSNPEKSGFIQRQSEGRRRGRCSRRFR